MAIDRPRFPKENKVLIVADYPTISELKAEEPFSSITHTEFITKLKRKAGIPYTSISYTYLSYSRPAKDDIEYKKSIISQAEYEKVFDKSKFNFLENCNVWLSDELLSEYEKTISHIALTDPKILLIVSKWSLLLLTEVTKLKSTRGGKVTKRTLGGLNNNRGSQIINDKVPYITFPMLLPNVKFTQPKKAILANWDYTKLKSIFDKIIKNNYNYPQHKLISFPNYDEVISYLEDVKLELSKHPIKISVDLETARGTIDRIGLAYESTRAISICFGTKQIPNYFTVVEELVILNELRTILLHANCQIVGQNWGYDIQYIKKFWLFTPHAYYDTMIIQHTIYNTLPKDLATLASIYCEYYTNWKGMVDFTEEENK